MTRPVVTIVGPTGVGKSALAVELALRLGGEIINADSRQVYRYMDIGTAKPSLEDRAKVPHHLIDIINPDREFSQATYLELAYKAIEETTARGNLSVLVGGTGLYVWSLLEGWQVPRIPPDHALRKTMQARAEQYGADVLYQELAAADPEAAKKIDPENIRRVIRALEVIKATGIPLSRLQAKRQPSFKPFILGLTVARQLLYRRIDQRVDNMIKAGWVDEVKKLLNMGYSADLPSMSSVGYRELAQHIRGQLTLEEAVQRIKFQTHQFARRQYAWFHLNDRRISWYDIAKLDIHDIIERIQSSLGIKLKA